MKRFISIAAAGVIALSLFSGCAAKSSGEAVSVESVGLITGVGFGYTADSYAGKVVSSRTAEIKKDSAKTVLEVLVEEGDMVKAGQVLFTYDTEAMQLSLDKLYLDRENLENSITSAETEIEELEKERAKAGADQQLSYTLQIDARRADIREAQYNLSLKDKEIENAEASMADTEVTSPLAGRVMSVGDAEDSDGSPVPGAMVGGTSDAFVTIMDVSTYRVEGIINEMNRGSITEGMPVIIRSRTDETQTWHGVIDSIDWDKPLSDSNNNMYGGNNDEMTTSSKYPFYVELDSAEGLLLGQHVYIEPDMGQDDEPAGLMLPAWYIVDESYVWAASSRDKLEKRSVTLGEYDAETDQYPVLSGLDYTDYIAFPEESLYEGMDVVYYDESSFGGDDEYYAAGPGGEELYPYEEGPGAYEEGPGAYEEGPGAEEDGPGAEEDGPGAEDGPAPLEVGPGGLSDGLGALGGGAN